MLFKELANDIIFYTRDAKFGYIKVKSKDKVTAASNVTKLLRIKERFSFQSTSVKKKVARVRVGRIPPEIEVVLVSCSSVSGNDVWDRNSASH